MENIVLDTNCLISSLKRTSIYYPIWRDFMLGKYCLCFSDEILDEYEEGAIYKQNVIEGTTVNPALTIKIYINAVNDPTGDVDPDVDADDVPGEDENDF